MFAACADSRLRSWDLRVSALRDDRGDSLQVNLTSPPTLTSLHSAAIELECHTHPRLP